MQSSNNTANLQIARAAGTVMMAFIISNLVGLVRNMIVIRFFGTGQELDSFYAANRIAETLFNLVAGGALGSAFIPTFTAFLARDDNAGAWKLGSSIANLLVIILSTISLAAAIFAPQIVKNGLFILDPTLDPVQEELTIRLLRILLPSVVIFGLSGLVMGILNASQIFLVPAIAPALYSFGWIIGVIFFPADWGIERLAWGAVLGALMHLLVQIPTLLKQKGKYTPLLGLGDPAVREVIRLMGPRLFGVAVVQMNFFVNTMIALSLPEGSASAIGQGFTLMLMPQVAIAQSIAIAAMPTFSAQVARGQKGEMRSSLAATLRGVLLLSIPAGIGLIMIREPLTGLLYQSNVCGIQCTQMISWALMLYAIGLVGHCLVEITSRAFYALHDTRTPVIIGVIAMSLNIILSLLFSRLFGLWGIAPHGGLALANSLATALEAVALLFMMRRRLNGLYETDLYRAAGAGLVAGLVMTALLWQWIFISKGQPDWLILVLGILLAGIGYSITLTLLRTREVSVGWNWIRTRIGRFAHVNSKRR